jgi:hypothetical protein
MEERVEEGIVDHVHKVGSVEEVAVVGVADLGIYRVGLCIAQLNYSTDTRSFRGLENEKVDPNADYRVFLVVFVSI